MAIAAAVIVFLGGFTFLATNTGPDEAKQQAISDDLAAWDAAPLATPEDEAASTDQPFDRAALCAAWDDAIGALVSLRPGMADPSSPWNTAMAEVARYAPPEAKADLQRYRDTYQGYYEVLDRSSPEEIEQWYDGEPTGELVRYERDLQAAQDALYPHLTPHCGEPGS